MIVTGSLYRGTPDVPEKPTIFTRYEKGQALTHAEMDTNLTSLIHTCSISKTASIKQAQFVTFSYAPQYMGDGQVSGAKLQRKPIIFQNTPSARDVREKIADEIITGSLGITNDLNVGKKLNVGKVATFEDDVYIKGKLFVHDWIKEKDFEGLTPGTPSDARLKTNIQPLTGSLSMVKEVNPVRFDWVDPTDKNHLSDIGVIAQEVQKVCPEVVLEGSDGYLKVDYAKLVTVLFGAVQELTKKVEQLEDNICVMTTRIN